jgi:hypothetical protein
MKARQYPASIPDATPMRWRLGLCGTGSHKTLPLQSLTVAALIERFYSAGTLIMQI